MKKEVNYSMVLHANPGHTLLITELTNVANIGDELLYEEKTSTSTPVKKLFKEELSPSNSSPKYSEFDMDGLIPEYFDGPEAQSSCGPSPSSPKALSIIKGDQQNEK